MRGVLILVLVTAAATPAQNLVNPSRLSAGMKDFDRGFRDLPLQCEVTPIKPALNFGFRFQAGYVASVPMHQYRGSGHTWTILTRITPEQEGREPSYLIYRTRLPQVPPTKMELEVGGAWLLGEGRYNIAWKLVDDSGRTCIHRWHVEARLGRSERLVKVALPPATVTDFSLRGVPSVHQTDDAAPIRLTILMHAAPLNPRRTRLGPRDYMMLLGTLSSVLERVPARSVRLVVFNLDQQKELYRQEEFAPQSLGQVARAIGGLELGLVDYGVLKNRGGHLDLLADLVNAELTGKEPADVVLFLGPQARTSDKVPREELERPLVVGPPRFFYIQYRPFLLQQSSLPDTINYAVNKMKGKTLVIHTPGEFAKAIDQIERKTTAPQP
ncbi:MAG TPA: hypothetical protein VGH38_25650 [Bryobacteraceae bacterium]|jgi:hypothetical protein